MRKLYRATALITFAIITITALMLRFMHPEYTETEFLLNYWALWCAYIGTSFTFYMLSRRAHD